MTKRTLWNVAGSVALVASSWTLASAAMAEVSAPEDSASVLRGPLSDREVFGLLETAQKGQTWMVQVAYANSRTPGVLALAKQISDDSSRIEDEVRRVARRLRARPQPSDVSQNLENVFVKNVNTLKAVQRGGNFDQMFIGYQIEGLKQVIGILDQVMKTTGGELWYLLDEIKKQTYGQLTTALALQPKPTRLDGAADDQN